MSTRQVTTLIAIAATGLLLVVSTAPAPAQPTGEPKLPLDLTSFAVNMGAPVGSPSTGRIDMRINRWSTDGERDRLLDALVEKGSEKLLRTLQEVRPPVGSIRAEGSLAWDIYFARVQPGTDGGYRLIFATDRPISFWEARNRTRSSEYEFMLCEIRMNRNGEGEGKLAVMAKVTFNQKTKTIEIENYDIEPIRLNKVQEAR
jgi:hypothetical protein